MNSRSGSNCVVRGCTVGYSNRPDGVVLIRFPRDERLPRWVEAVKGKGSDWVPPINTKICSLHFAPKDFWKNPPGKRKKLLLPGAIPIPAPQLPPASSILIKHLPNSTTYIYRKKGGAGDQSSNPEALASPQQQQQQQQQRQQSPILSGPPVPICLDIEEDDSPCEIALKQMIVHLENQLRQEQKRCQQEKRRCQQAEKRCEKVENELNALKQEKKRCQQAEKRCEKVENELNALKQEKKRCKQAEKRCGKVDNELDALKEIVKKALDFDLSCYSIDEAPSHWGDKAVIWHARPALMGP